MLRSIYLLINPHFNKSDLTKYRIWLVVKGDCQPEDNANYSEINRKLSLWLDQINQSISVRLICTIQRGHRFFALQEVLILGHFTLERNWCQLSGDWFLQGLSLCSLLYLSWDSTFTCLTTCLHDYYLLMITNGQAHFYHALSWFVII